MSVPVLGRLEAINSKESNSPKERIELDTNIIYKANISEHSLSSQPCAVDDEIQQLSLIFLDEDLPPIECASENIPLKTINPNYVHTASSREICTKYIAQSDSSVLRHPAYAYLFVKDPGIEEALRDPIRSVTRADDGQALYLDLCKEMNIHPIGLFYRGLMTNEINLSYYGVNPLGVRPMALALQYNDYVKTFNLTDNFLTPHACFHLGEMLYLNSKLQELNMTGCRIGPTGLMNLGRYLYINKTLKSLNLARNNINEEGSILFAKMLVNGTSLACINLSKNNLGLEASYAFANVFQFYGSKMITHLDLSLNEFYNPIATSKMILSLCFSDILQELNLAWNSLQGKIIADSIKHVMLIPTLTKLDLSNNKFTGEDITIIVEHLKKARNLVTLDLSSNPLKPTDAETALKEMLKKKVKLQNLLMSNVTVNHDFIILLQRVKRKKSRKHFVVTYGYVHKTVIVGVDPRELILKRVNYIANLRKADMVRFFWMLKWEYPVISVKDLPTRADAARIHLNDDLIEELGSIFAGPKHNKMQYINLTDLCDFLQRLWPNRKPIPPPSKAKPEDVLFESAFSKLISSVV